MSRSNNAIVVGNMHGRDSKRVEALRWLQRMPLAWLQPLERELLRRARARDSGPNLIFLIALPRSGSTVTYQALCHALRSLYVSNLANLLYQLPFLGLKISSKYCDDHESDFRSSKGFVSGPCGPAEALKFWTYWMDNGLDEVARSDISRDMMASRIRHLVRVFETLGRKDLPLITGYVGHVLAFPHLKELFPGAIFLRLKREPLENALSLLKCHREAGKGWFSVMPKECTHYEALTTHERVAAQVYWLNRRLIDMEGWSNTVVLDYEELCEDPAGSIQAVANFCDLRGMALERTRRLPQKLSRSHPVNEDKDDIARIQEALLGLERQFGPVGSCLVSR